MLLPFGKQFQLRFKLQKCISKKNYPHCTVIISIRAEWRLCQKSEQLSERNGKLSDQRGSIAAELSWESLVDRYLNTDSAQAGISTVEFGGTQSFAAQSRFPCLNLHYSA